MPHVRLSGSPGISRIRWGQWIACAPRTLGEDPRWVELLVVGEQRPRRGELLVVGEQRFDEPFELVLALVWRRLLFRVVHEMRRTFVGGHLRRCTAFPHGSPEVAHGP